MRRVYKARDPADAHRVRALLESAGLRAVILGEGLGSVAGELPAFRVAPEVWTNERDALRARALLIDVPCVADADHCPQCGYSLIGLPQSRCPECGLEFDWPPPQPPGASPPAWVCQGCGEVLEAQFTACWACGQEREPICGT